MWLLDILNPKIRAQKKEYREMNYSQEYSKAFESLINFSEIQLMIFRITDRDLSLLLNDEGKLLKMIYFFGGAADYMTQVLNLNDDEAIKFISFFIVLTLFNGDYKKMNYAKIMYMAGTLVPELNSEETIQLGADTYVNMFKEDVDRHNLSLTLRRLLKD